MHIIDDYLPFHQSTARTVLLSVRCDWKGIIDNQLLPCDQTIYLDLYSDCTA